MRRLHNHLIISFLLTFFAVNAINGQIPALFNVTGSGSYCSGSSGLSISVSGSEVGVNYQLENNGIDEGALVPGTGSALIWYNQIEGVYEVVATMVSSGLSEKMNGKAIIIETPLPVVTFGYGYEKTITINSAQVSGTQDLMDFPMLVSIPNDNNLKTTGNGGNVQNSDGYDIVFTDNNYNPIPFEKISYNPATGAYSAWVKVPSVSYNTDTDIHILYGKSGITTDPSSNETWSADYIQVMHMEGDLTDASLTGNYGLNDGTSISGGKLGSGRSFNGINNKIIVFDDPTLDGTNDEATFSLWINWVNSADGDYQIVMVSSNRFPGTGGGFEWASQNVTGNFYFYPNGDNNNNYNLGPNPFTNGIWHYLAVTLRYSTKTVNIYVDGVPMVFGITGVPTFWTSLANINEWWWGGHTNVPTRYFAGIMDEIRVQTVSRSGAWLLTEYTNQNNPSGFYSLSAESSFEPLADLCLDNPAYVLDLSKPAGGSYSGTGVSGGMFYPAIAGAGTHTITYNYTDVNGCAASGTKVQTVHGLPSPIITGNNNLCPNASSETYSTPAVVGNSYNWAITGTGASITGGQGTNQITVDWGNDSGTVNVTETIDATGCNSTTADFNVTIGDVTNPVITSPGDLTAVCDISEQPVYVNHAAFLTAGGMTSDNCAIDPLSFNLVSEVSDGLSCPETISRTYSISDVNGNLQSCTQKIVIKDYDAPVFAANPGNLTAQCDISEQPAYANYAAFVAAGGSVTDNCGINSASFLLVSEISDGLIGPETITRTYWIADLCGNTVSYSQKIVISENVDPVIVCSSDIDKSVDPGKCYSTVIVPAPVASDNCGISSVINDFNGSSDASGNYPTGITTVIWTATDLSGNIGICIQKITVTDDEGPVITCPGDRTEYLDGNCEFIIPDYATLTSVTDDCDPAPVTAQSPLAGTVITGAGTVQPITIYSVDAGGNSSQCIFSILLQDNTLPVLACLRDSTIYIDRGMSSAQITLSAPVTSDNCGIQSVINDFNGGANASGIYPEGTTTVIYTVTDNSGNSIQCSQKITLILKVDLLYNLIIPQGFSPNNDGLNDNFEIIGIEDYPDNELRIYNINGVEVYTKKNYDNTWHGSSSGKMSKNGKLPTGTYYYVIDLGKDRVVKGYVYLIQE